MKILAFGGSGLVGSRFVDLFKDVAEIVAPTHEEVDVTDEGSVTDYIKRIKPDQILYAAGFTNVDLAEAEQEMCIDSNAKAPEYIVNAIKNTDTNFYYLSTDYVFDGKKSDAPYKETDLAEPVDAVYAKSKKTGEDITLSETKNCVIRLIMPFSAKYQTKMDLARLIVSKLQNGENLVGIVDQKVNPIFVDDLVQGIFLIMKDKKTGIYHLGAKDYTTPYEYMCKIAKVFGFDESLITKTSFKEFAETRKAKRPQNSWLDTSKFQKEFGENKLHTIDEELLMFKDQLRS